MEIQRYDPFCIKDITPSRNSTLVNFANVRKTTGVFASPDIYSSASLASQSLSITFSPRHRYSFDPSTLKLLDNEGIEITNPFPSTITRTWPAFGKTGGGKEVFVEMCLSDTIAITGQHQYLDGGLFDLYHQDAILPLAEATLSLISTGAAEFLEGSARVTKNGLPVFKSTIGKDLFSISVGTKETPDGMMLHLWGAKWKDDNHRRLIYCYIEDHFDAWSVGVGELVERFKQSDDPLRNEFINKIKSMVDSLRDGECYFNNWLVHFRRPGILVRLP